MSDIRKLIEMVESSSIAYSNLDPFVAALGMNTQANDAHMAYRGSLDTAKALHEALLPGWVARPQIGGAGAGVKVWHCTIEDWDTGYEIEANNMKCPARAWLLAVLRAVEEKQ